MITLSASGGSVTFTFSGNSTYLNDGTITVPVNSLALIIDESDMATFKKAASNDIFVSANVSEFGMTKAELESWYKANMVGSTGGGGGVTTGEVQTMIDESISGKADSSDVYTTGQTSGATEIANALNAKLDATAYTPTVVDAALSQSSTNPVQNQALYGELRVGGGTSKVEIDFNTGGYVPEGVTQLEVNPTTTDSWAYYNFYNGNTNLGGYHFTNWGSFEVGNSLEGSSYVISGETVIITYPTSLGVTRIAQDGGNEPWSFKAIVETPAVPLKDVVSGKMDTSAYTVDASVNSASTNPVAGGAVYDKVHVTSGESSETVLIFEEITVGGHKNTLSTNYPSGATIVKLDINNIPSYAGYLEWFGADGSVLGGAKITQNGGNFGVDFNHPDLKAMSGTASYADNVLTVEVTGFQNASLSDIAYFFRDLASTYNSIKAVKTAKEYWIKDYVDAALSGKADSSAVTEEISAAVSGKVDMSAITTAVTSGSTDSEIPTAKAVYDYVDAKIAELLNQINNS